MAKSRPPGSSQTERKRDSQETSALKSPPSPTTPKAEHAGPAADPAPSKAAESESLTTGSTSAAKPAAMPIPSQVSTPATASPVPSSPSAESVVEPKGSRPPSPAASVPAPLAPTAISVAKPDPRPIAEARPFDGAKPLPVIKRALESGATAESKGAVERTEPAPEGTTAEVKPAAELKPATGTTAAGSKSLGATIIPATAKPSTPEPPQPLVAPQASPGVTTEAPVLPTAISAKPDRESDAVRPSPARQTTQTAEGIRAASKVGTTPTESGAERPASVHPNAEFVVAKEAASSLKPQPTTGQDMPAPAVLPAEQVRSPGPAAARIS